MEGHQDDSPVKDEGSIPEIPEKRKRRKRGSGSGAKIFQRKKQGRPKSSLSTGSAEDRPETPSTSQAESSDVSLLASETTATETEAETLNCEEPFTSSHVCGESDFFDDSESDQDTPSEPSKHRRRKSKLAYPKKVKKLTKQESDSDIDVVGDSEAATSSNKEKTGEQANLDQETTVSAIATIVNHLKLILCEEWIVDDVEHQFLRLIKLNQSSNARVELSITYDLRAGSTFIFVLGCPVTRDHSIFDTETLHDPQNFGSVADFLCRLSNSALNLKLCPGLTENQELWDITDGFQINNETEEESRFRSSKCFLLVDQKCKRCKSCWNLEGKYSRILKQKNKTETVASVPDKFLTKGQLKIKKEDYRMKYYQQKKKGERLQRRVEQLEVKLDEALKDELTALLRANQHKMTPLQLLFWESQRKAIAASDRRGLRWHPMLIRLALRLHSYSDAGYEFLQETGVLVLPSKRRLYDYSHFIDAQEGCQGEIISYINAKIERKGTERHYKFINLMFDEMHIRAGLVTKKSTAELIGYTNLSKVEEELKIMQSELEMKAFKPKLAKKVLVYLAQGITSDIKDVVAVYSTDDLSSSQLYDRSWEVIYCLESAGIKVLTVTCDGAAINRKFIKMHSPYDSSCSHTFCTINLAAGDLRPLYFIIDPPHLLKTIRNAFANSYAHRKTRKLWKNGEQLSWKVIEQVYELTKGDKFRDHKLTKAHIKLSSFSCMTVSYATQVLSKSVADCIKKLADHESMKLFDTNELIKFILITNRFFDCFNGMTPADATSKVNPDLAAYSDSSDDRLQWLLGDFLNYFEDWKNDIENRPGIFTVTEKNQMIISHQALEALQITVRGFVGAVKFMLDVAGAPYIFARLFNQDALEQYFSIVRRKQGDNDNPSLKGVLDTRLNIHASGHFALPSSSGNTEVEKRKDLEVDDSPLPSRKKPKKETKK